MTKKQKRRLKIVSLVLVVIIGSILFLKRDKGIIHQGEIEAAEALTKEEKVEDFEYLCGFLEDNYPLLKSDEGVDWVGEKDNFKASIEDTSTDKMFIDELTNIVAQLNDDFTQVLPDSSFKHWYALYASLENEDDFKPWAEVIKDEKILKRYRFHESQLRTVERMNKQQEGVGKRNMPGVPAFKSKKIVPGEVAYLEFQSMSVERIKKDCEPIREFLEEVKNYEKLILDLRTVLYWLGDEDAYWIKNIIEPLIDEEISVDNYMLRRGEYGKKFHDHKGTEFMSLEELSDEIVNEELKKDFDYYNKENITIKPVDSIGFNGEIYIIIDEMTAFIAENLASFCKDSGFATLVGEENFGMNEHVDNPIFSLPNSGILVGIRDIVFLNNDGTINQKVNLRPDIEVDSAIGDTYEIDKAIQYIINN